MKNPSKKLLARPMVEAMINAPATVQTSIGPILVREMPFPSITDAIRDLFDIVKVMADKYPNLKWEQMDGTIIAGLVIETGLVDKLVSFVSLSTPDTSPERLKELGLADATSVFSEVIRVNNLPLIVENFSRIALMVRGAMEVRKKQAPIPKVEISKGSDGSSMSSPPSTDIPLST